MERAVKGGLSAVRRKKFPTSAWTKRRFARESLCDAGGRSGPSRVLYVAPDRKQSSLDGFSSTLNAKQKDCIQGVAMDMWEPYELIKAHLPAAEEKIVYESFTWLNIWARRSIKFAPRRTSNSVLRRRSAGGNPLRLAAEPQCDGRSGLAGVPRLPEKQLEDCAGLGLEGKGDGGLGLHLRETGVNILSGGIAGPHTADSSR